MEHRNIGDITADLDSLANKILNDPEQPYHSATNSNTNPFYALCSGGPGTGKKFLSKLLEMNGTKNFVHINDEVFHKHKIFEHTHQRQQPHQEKHVRNIQTYYALVEKIIEKAADKNISIVLEDNGDYPKEYQYHTNLLKEKGYDTFLLDHTMSPKNYEAKVKRIMNKGGDDRSQWGIAYNDRLVGSYEKMAPHFDAGMMIEIEKKYMGTDDERRVLALSRFHTIGKETTYDALNQERLNTIRKQWEDLPKSEESQYWESYFTLADSAMEQRARSKADDGHYSSIGGGGNHKKPSSFLERLVLETANPTMHSK